MGLNKKGVLMTLISAGIMLLVITMFMPSYEHLPQMSKIRTIQTRVTKANDFMFNLHDNMIERSLRDSSYHAVWSLIEYIDDTGRPLGNFSANFTEVVTEGTINGVDLEDYGIYHMQNRTIGERLEVIKELAHEELYLDMNLSINNISVFQSNNTGYTSFGVSINVSCELDADLAQWNSTSVVFTVLDVDEFEDPYYIMNNGYENRISFSDRNNWTVEQVRNQILDINYTFQELAPSFLMRFENSTQSSKCCGMESFINPDKLSITEDEPWAYVDYCYYGHHCNNSKPNNKSLWNITGISENISTSPFYGFKLDIFHAGKYNLTGNMDVPVVIES